MTPVAQRIEDYGLIGTPIPPRWSARTVDRLAVSARFDSDAVSHSCSATTHTANWRISPATQDSRCAALPGRHLSARDRIRDRRRHRQGRRLHAHSRSASPGGADGRSRPGEVAMRMDLVIRFGYWVDRCPGASRHGTGCCAIAGPDALALVDAHRDPRRGHDHVAEFTVVGHRAHSLRPHLVPSTRPRRVRSTPVRRARHRMCGGDWSANGTFEGEWRDPVMRRSSP